MIIGGVAQPAAIQRVERKTAKTAVIIISLRSYDAPAIPAILTATPIIPDEILGEVK